MLTLADYQVLNRAFTRLTWYRRVARGIYWVFIAALAAVATFSIPSGDWLWAAYMAVMAGLLLALQLVVTPWHQARQFRHQRLDELEIELEANPEGFSARTPISDAWQSWNAVRQVDDLPEHVIMWPNNRIGWIVPKRAFKTPDEAAEFAAFAKEKASGPRF